MASSSMFTSLLQSIPSSKFSFRINSGIGLAAFNPLLAILEGKLTNQLELLRLPSDQDRGYLSAEWLHNAMSMVVFANSNAKTSVPDLQNTLSDSGTYGKWLDECLDDNIRLLDACLIMQETLSCSIIHLTYVKAVLATLAQLSDKPASKATLRRAARALSHSGKLAQKKITDMSSKTRSKLETCGSVLRRMGEKLYSLEDAYKGNGWGVMYVAHMITIFVCGVLITAFSIGPRRANMSTISISSQSNWSLALAGLQQRIKEEVETKRAKTQRMPYLEELENVDTLHNTLGEMITQAVEADQFPIPSEEEEPIRRAMVELRRASEELGDGLEKLGQDIYELYQVLITSRMMLLDIYPKSLAIPRSYLESVDGKQS